MTLLEVCVDSIESARAAREGGADRLEVCGPLSVGGTTPSQGLVQRCAADVRLPIMMMIRPHDGGFVYDNDDIETMRADIEIARSIGVQGVVFGALTAKRHVHVALCRQLLEAARGMETTFHRAFDVAADPIQALNQIIELGFDRLLTSGQAATAQEGIPFIQELCQRSQDRIAVMAGAGVNSHNAQQIVAATGVRELHASAGVSREARQSKGQVAFGHDRQVTSAELVRAIRQSLL